MKSKEPDGEQITRTAAENETEVAQFFRSLTPGGRMEQLEKWAQRHLQKQELDAELREEFTYVLQAIKELRDATWKDRSNWQAVFHWALHLGATVEWIHALPYAPLVNGLRKIAHTPGSALRLAEVGSRVTTGGKRSHEKTHGTREQKVQKWAVCQEALDAVRLEHPDWKRSAVQAEAAKRADVSFRTIERRTVWM